MKTDSDVSAMNMFTDTEKNKINALTEVEDTLKGITVETNKVRAVIYVAKDKGLIEEQTQFSLGDKIVGLCRKKGIYTEVITAKETIYELPNNFTISLLFDIDSLITNYGYECDY